MSTEKIKILDRYHQVQAWEREARAQGLTLTQQAALAVMDGQRLTLGGFSDAMGINGSSATLLVDILERKCLLRRERDTTDRRKVYIVPTSGGSAAAD